MNKKVKRISILALVVMLIASLCALFACAKGKEVDIKFKENPVIYRVSDNVDPYDFIVRESDVDYFFTVTYFNAEEKKNVTDVISAQSFCARFSGEHTIDVTATSGDNKDTDSVKFTVMELEPYLLINASKLKVYDLGTKIKIDKLLATMDSYQKSDIASTITTDYVEFYEDEDSIKDINYTPEKIVIDPDEPLFVFDREGYYLFNIIMTSAGGSTTGTYRVKCEENLSKVELLSNAISFDKATNKVTFDGVPTASKYKIKVGTRSLFTENNTQTSVDISSILSTATFKYFDIVVLPLDAEGVKTGKIILKDVVVNPDGHGYNDQIILSKNATIDLQADPRTVSLLGGTVSNFFFKDTSELVNDYIAFSKSGGFGANYYLDFEFTGNNLPNVNFFSNDVSGNITNSEGGKGLFLMNGLSTFSGGFYREQLRVYGPSRLSETIWDSGNALQFAYNEDKLNPEFPLFGQEVLASNANAQYKYTVGTFADQDGNIFIDIELKVKKGNDYVLAENSDGTPYKIIRATRLTTADFDGDKIVVYASVKGQNQPTVFKFSNPYYKESPEYITNGMVGSNAIVSNDGKSFSLKEDNCFEYYEDGEYPDGVMFLPEAIDNLKNGYVGLKGDYGVGTYLRIKFGATAYNGKFRADNMPNVILFSDNTNPGFTSASGKGILLTPGIDACNMFSQSMYNEAMYIHGPNRIVAKADGTNYNNKDVENDGALAYFLSPELTQLGLAKYTEGEFTYIVGSFIGENNTVVLDISIYYQLPNGTVTKIVSKYVETNLSESELTGGNIVLVATNKHGTWNDSTVFSCEITDRTNAIPQDLKTADSVIQGENETISLVPDNYYIYYPDTNYNYDAKMQEEGALALLRNEFVGIADKGVGTYIKIKFAPTDYNGTMRADNIPNVILFADNMNPGFTSVSGKGLLVTPGIDACNMFDASPYNDSMRIYGPNRLSASLNYNQSQADGGYLTKFNYNAGYPLLSQYRLKEYTEGEFTYVIGTYLSASQTVVVDINMYYELDGKLVEVESKTFDTGLTEAQLPGTNIMLVAANKYGTWASPTVFEYEVTNRAGSVPSEYNVKGQAKTKADGTTVLNPDGFFDYDLPGKIDTLKNGYLALKGDYGVGTYVKIDFVPTEITAQGQQVVRGDNLPNVVLFADNLENGFTQASGNGILVTPGISPCNSDVYSNKMEIYGPNRLSSSSAYGSSALGSFTDKLLNQKGLATYTQGKFSYIIGSYLDADDKVVIDINVYYELNDKLVECANKLVNTGLTEAQLTGRNIIFMATNKYNTWGQDTEFKYEIMNRQDAIPSAYGLKGTASFNGDGTVSLVPENFFSDALKSSLTTMQNGYIGLEGNYGVGTYLRINFKPSVYNTSTVRSDNIPNVILFADEINGGLTSAWGKGLLVTAGVEGCNVGSSDSNNAMRIFGLNRIDKPNEFPWQGLKSFTEADYPLLTQHGLSQITEGDFTYVIGTYLSQTNTVVVEIKIYQVIGGEVSQKHEVEYDTQKQASEFTGSNIVMTAANKGAVWGTAGNGDTTFSYTITDRANAVPAELRG